MNYDEKIAHQNKLMDTLYERIIWLANKVNFLEGKLKEISDVIEGKNEEMAKYLLENLCDGIESYLARPKESDYD